MTDKIYQSLPCITPATIELTKEYEKSKIIRLIDHMPATYDFRIHIDHKRDYKKNSYIQLFEAAGIDYNEKIFLAEYYFKFEDFKKVISIDNFFIKESEKFFKNVNVDIIKHKKINKHLTFMSNKSRPSRSLLSRLLMNMFDKEKINYTYVKNNNLDQMISEELLIGTDYNFKDINLPELYYIFDNNDTFNNNSFKIDYNASCNFKYFLRLYDNLFSTSATSLITEPSYYETGVIFTEKTLMSIYSGHFLIWPGGYKHAEAAKAVGIDIFEDIIDHSYQYIDHPGKRVVEAILRNWDFLNNIELQDYTRYCNIHRLQSNLDLVRNLDKLKNNIENLQIGNQSLDHSELAYIRSELMKYNYE